MEWIENGVRIFELTPHDSQWLSTAATLAYLDNYQHLWFDKGEWYAQRCFNPEQLRKELLNENSLFFGVEDENEALGFLKMNIDKPLSKETCQSKFWELLTFDTCETTNALELERIYLSLKGQGRGVGRRLVQLTYDFARTRGKDIVWLKAMDTSADAISFYEKMGFKPFGTMCLNFEKMKPEMCGMVAMEKAIFGR